MIHIIVIDAQAQLNWDIIFVHSSDDHIMQNHLSFVKDYVKSLSDVHLLMGDFNAILKCNEKQVGLPYIDPKMSLFRNFVNYLNLIDLNFVSPTMTWNNHRDGANDIQKRIDRCLPSLS